MNPALALAMMQMGQSTTAMLASPSGPRVAGSGSGLFDQHFDGSGWVVSTGSNTQARALPTVTSAVQDTAANAMTALQNPMLLLALAAVAVMVVRHS
ncbi:hypothetical protein [Ralstonia sp.]|uniref:hypothetical protein n=1 Tax=Ralstonia sp. TaxID=54061 RepID=UPI0031DDFCC6